MTLTLAVSNTRLEKWSIVEGSSNSRVFMAFVLSLADCPQRYVLLDNVAFHKSKAVLAAFERMGKIPVFIPPYSPEFNPIENVFSYIKSAYRPKLFEANPALPHRNVLEQCLTGQQDVFLRQCKGAFRATWSFTPSPSSS